MQNWFGISAAVVVAAVAATSVQAADLIVDDVAVEAAVPVGDWTGAYVGGHIGWASGTVDWETVPPGVSDSYDIDGFLIGVQGGYNWQMDTFVLGVEGDISFSGIEGDDAGGFIARQINWAGSLRARAGVSFDTILLYGTAGVAFANSTGEVFIADDTNTHFGWTAGVGVEAMLTDNVSAKLEYRYTDYGAQDYDYTFVQTETGITAHSLTAGVNFHF